MGRTIFSFKYVATVFLTVGILILGFLNAQQKRGYIPPDDGASWIQGPAGIQARLVVPHGPAERAGIRQNDILKPINGPSLRDDLYA